MLEIGLKAPVFTLKDKDGNFISGYPDKDNHFIDAVRYALNDEIMRSKYIVAGGIRK